MKNLIKNIYVTTCGRIFNKKTYRRAVGDMEIIPTLTGTFNRICNRLELDKRDFVKTFSGHRSSSREKLYYYKYNKFVMPYFEPTQTVGAQGYKTVCCGSNTYKAHRVIAAYFYGVNEDMQVNHIDGNKKNNCISNLEYCTAKENINHAWKIGLSNMTEESKRKIKKTSLSKLNINHVCNIKYQGQKPNIKSFLRARELSFDDYNYIITGRTLTGHALGYLTKK